MDILLEGIICDVACQNQAFVAEMMFLEKKVTLAFI